MATTVKQSIGEHDYVELTHAIAKSEGSGTWPAGTRAAVISDLGDHKMIDISDEHGVPFDMPVVPVSKLKLITKHHA